MHEPQNSSSAGRRCPQCGAELPGDLPPDLCPKCLLKAGLATQPQTGPAGTIIVSAEGLSRGLPQPGEQLGHYRIVRSLGGGGMGTVFEAEDLENGRRVALKVLSQALDSPEARQRFFREGRLAARSIIPTAFMSLAPNGPCLCISSEIHMLRLNEVAGNRTRTTTG